MKEYYNYEIKDIYGNIYVICAYSIKEAKQKLQMQEDIFEDEIEDWNYLNLWK